MTFAAAIDQAPAPRRVLVILLGAIGDVVRALPLIGRLRHAWPGAHIAWAVEPKSAPILERHQWLDELIIYDRSRAPVSFFGFLRQVRSGRFDLALDLQRHLKSGLASIVSGAPDRIGFASANTKEFNHRFATRHIDPQPRMRLKLLQYQAFADALGLPETPIAFGLALSPEEQARAAALVASTPRPRVAVILGSSWPSRIYFPSMVAEVIAELARPADGEGFHPVLIAGPDESALAGEVMLHLGASAVTNLAGRTNLRDLIGILGECDAAFGPDSGPMHIAAAVGCPIVSLWGSTAPQRSAPWGNAEWAISAPIPCHPCYLRDCPIGRECMRRIEPAEVARTVRLAVARRLASDALARQSLLLVSS
ncbi:MAG: glycosyltransferase family 9 protein [Candidatus Binataceae bacterium]|jgi:lipopolysaccharide heptosyltransferase II